MCDPVIQLSSEPVGIIRGYMWHDACLGLHLPLDWQKRIFKIAIIMLRYVIHSYGCPLQYFNPQPQLLRKCHGTIFNPQQQLYPELS